MRLMGPVMARQWPVSGPSVARQWPVSGPSWPVMARQGVAGAWLGRGWGATGAWLGLGWAWVGRGWGLAGHGWGVGGARWARLGMGGPYEQGYQGIRVSGYQLLA